MESRIVYLSPIVLSAWNVSRRANLVFRNRKEMTVEEQWKKKQAVFLTKSAERKKKVAELSLKQL